MLSLTLDSMLKSMSVALAPVWWFIEVAMYSSSFRSSLELNELFKAMFSDSIMASLLQ